MLPLDAGDAAALEAATNQATARWGPWMLWVVSVFSPVKEMEADKYRRVTEVSCLGYVLETFVALKHMSSRDQEHVIHIGSAVTYRSIALQRSRRPYSGRTS